MPNTSPHADGFPTPADVDDETRALLVEAAASLPRGHADLIRRLLAHADRIPEPDGTQPCELVPGGGPRCGASAVVRIVDPTGAARVGCHEHAVRALRAIAGARVYPLDGHDGAAIDAYVAAHQ